MTRVETAHDALTAIQHIGGSGRQVGKARMQLVEGDFDHWSAHLERRQMFLVRVADIYNCAAREGYRQYLHLYSTLHTLLGQVIDSRLAGVCYGSIEDTHIEVQLIGFDALQAGPGCGVYRNHTAANLHLNSISANLGGNRQPIFH